LLPRLNGLRVGDAIDPRQHLPGHLVAIGNLLERFARCDRASCLKQMLCGIVNHGSGHLVKQLGKLPCFGGGEVRVAIEPAQSAVGVEQLAFAERLVYAVDEVAEFRPHGVVGD